MAELKDCSRFAGAAMIAAALGTILAMTHHPTGAHGGPLGAVVHGAMIVLLMVIAFGFAMFAIRRGLARPFVIAGVIAYAVSLFAHIGAATINGFVVPALADPQAPPASHDLFRLLWHANQALAHLGVYATGAAFTLWSIDLINDSARPARLAGVAGVAAGFVPALLLASDIIRMDVTGASIVYAAHAAWTVLVGLLLWGAVLQPRPGRVN